MSKLLERAVAAASSLPDDEQETIASLILKEMEAERGWQERFGKYGGKLVELARRARAHQAAGQMTERVFPPDE
jgi:hypothetical protein